MPRRRTMTEVINGGAKTGIDPYMRDDGSYFNHKWMLLIAEAKN